MKRFNFIIALFLLCQAVWAQKPNRQVSVDHKVEHLSQELKLSDSQQEEFRRILSHQEEQTKALHTEKKALRDSIHILHRKSHEEMKAVLTPEQIAAFEAMQPPSATKHRAFNKERIKAYHSARADFDEKLTPAERSSIDTARLLRKEIVEIKRTEASDEDHELIKNLRKQIHATLEPIVEQHESELSSALSAWEEQHPLPEHKEGQGPNKRKNRKYYMFLMAE